MTVKYVLAFDPGKSSGVALLSYSETEPVRLVKAWQFGNGVQGLLDWLENHYPNSGWLLPYSPDSEAERLFWSSEVVVVSEKFTPLQGKGFAQTLDSTLPLVCEGVLIAYWIMPVYTKGGKRWQRPNTMYMYGGSTLAEKKKRAREFLKKHGLYVTGKELGAPDNNDAVSAILHGIAYVVKTLEHRPTWDAYFEETE